ncbi:helix-turn-helix transcriptional regulator [Corynebacterium timonense]|uniref:Regulatory protein, luxR family n=1 Tax=Corynebacterium timonense TaxID=441500 RepID=A0A1H1U5X5_9CORY|nr:response regulator transcription factor [Corynebacterium timonense]SDS67656.1 regulatory protein, luxR family [Corynebacterium timonense]
MITVLILDSEADSIILPSRIALPDGETIVVRKGDEYIGIDAVLADYATFCQTRQKHTAASRVVDAHPVIVACADPTYAVDALHDGAAAVIGLPVDAAELTSAVYAIAKPGRYLSQRILAASAAWTARAADGSPHLSPREVQVLALLSAGLSDTDIATELFVTPATVHTHLLNLRRKLDARNRTHAVVKAIELGFIPPTLPIADAATHGSDLTQKGSRTP